MADGCVLAAEILKAIRKPSLKNLHFERRIERKFHHVGK